MNENLYLPSEKPTELSVADAWKKLPATYPTTASEWKETLELIFEGAGANKRVTVPLYNPHTDALLLLSGIAPSAPKDARLRIREYEPSRKELSEAIECALAGQCSLEAALYDIGVEEVEPNDYAQFDEEHDVYQELSADESPDFDDLYACLEVEGWAQLSEELIDEWFKDAHDPDPR